MKRLFSILLMNIVLFSVKAQNVTLAVLQHEPLKINALLTDYKVISGNKIVLGKDITIRGGSGNYRKSWSSVGWTNDSIRPTITITPLVTTVYTFKVFDENGCSDQQSFQVEVITPLQLEYTTTQISCFGNNSGSITLKVTGGVPPYNFVWSNGNKTDILNNLLPGDYIVTVTDNMKQVQVKTITIKVPTPIRNELYVSICEGSSYKFSGLELTKTGKYNSTLKAANGCDSIVTLILTVNPVYEQIINAAICEGSTYQFAGFERSVTWKYKNVFTTKNGCDSTIILDLKVNPLPKVPTIKQNGDTLKSSSLIGNQWLKEGVEMNGETKQTLVISHSGNYKVVITNITGCSSTSAIYSAIKTDVPIIQTVDFTCKVFPNPNNGMFTIELESDQSEILDLELFTNEGKSILRQTVHHPSGKQQILFGKTNLPDGIYNLQIKFGSGIQSRRIIVN